MSNVAQWFAAEKESPAFYAWGESQSALKDQPEAQKKMETIAPLMKEYGAIVKKIYKSWNDSATENVEEDPWA